MLILATDNALQTKV